MSSTTDAPGDDTLPEPPQSGDGLFGPAPAASGAAPAPGLPTASPPNASPQTYRVLARKYRPVTFDDMIGQEAMVRVLRRAFAVGRVAHAFMLTGVRGVGKTTTARIIARALACTGPDGQSGPTADPCGVCPNCVAILADRHPDIVEMDAASRTGVDDVREIIEATRFRPMQARCKVFIIDEVHMLSRNAFNALLKTLEEPPSHVTFVFATTELRKVPVTVLSRCQRFDLRRVPQDVLAAHFGRIAAAEGIEVDEAALQLIARAADGSVRDGLSLLDQAIAQNDPGEAATRPIAADAVAEMLGLADRAHVFDLLEAALGGRAADALRIAGELHARGADPGLVLADLLDLVHTLTRIRSVPGLAASSELPELERVRGGAMAERLSIPALTRAWQMLLKGIGEVEQAPSRQQAAEMVLIRLCYAADLPPPGELVRRLQATPSGPSQAASEGGAAEAGSSAASPAPRGNLALAPRAQRAPGGETMAALGAETVAELGAETSARPVAQAPARMPQTWREIVALVADTGREPMLHGHLRHAVHPVRIAPPVLEIRVEEGAPRDLAGRLAQLLSAQTGTRWTVALSRAPGEPTLEELGRAVRDAGRRDAEQHPMVLEILRLFPGARIGEVRDRRLDAYGLPPPDDVMLGGPDLPPFAPVDAERAFDVMPADPEDLPEDMEHDP